MNAPSRIREAPEQDLLAPLAEVIDHLEEHHLALTLAQSYLTEELSSSLPGPTPDVKAGLAASDRVHALMGVVVRDLDASREALDNIHAELLQRRAPAQSKIARHVQMQDWVSAHARLAAAIGKWEVALDRYQSAKSDYEKGAQSTSDDPPASLDDAVVDALVDLVDTPAPSLKALWRKLIAIQHENHIAADSVLEAIIADVEAFSFDDQGGEPLIVPDAATTAEMEG